MAQPKQPFEPLDHTRPFLDIIKEQAQQFRSYPHRLVEQFETLPRELFVPEEWQDLFRDRIHRDAGYGGLLSQPGVIFGMVAALHLKGTEVVFEGGTGTGYQTAILAGLCSHVYTVERDGSRLKAAKQRLASLGISNVTCVHGDAAQGLPQSAPFDRMIFGAAIHDQVDQHLIDQMASARSRLVVPTGTYHRQRGMIIGDLLLCDKKGGEVTQKITSVYHGTLSFVPLISPRSIGWTPLKDGYVPSTLTARLRSRLPWNRPHKKR
ncbi:MAG: protein-L-isoaspartate O-methyltransferase [Ktedonobacteraceae bacterium]|nr:protein-L-isoaspartate O-methyltransferase [Ktedonobacteraceae bacterium]